MTGVEVGCDVGAGLGVTVGSGVGLGVGVGSGLVPALYLTVTLLAARSYNNEKGMLFFVNSRLFINYWIINPQRYIEIFNLTNFLSINTFK